MGDLVAKSPCAGLLPIRLGPLTLSEVDPGAMTAIAPYKGQEAALSKALRAAHGVGFPAPNRSGGGPGARAIWFGRDMALLLGPAPDPGLARWAALSDQSDGWAVVRLDGVGARDVLARLTPLDLRTGVFAQGHTARSDLRHMMASITRVGAEAYQIMVFRSMAETLVHDLQTAMQSVTAR